MNRRNLLKTLFLAPLIKLLPKTKVAESGLTEKTLEKAEKPQYLTWTSYGSDDTNTFSITIYISNIDGEIHEVHTILPKDSCI